MSTYQDFDQLPRAMKERSSARNSLLLLAILGIICAAVAWAYFTKIDDETRADGRFVPSGDVQIIEAAENGVLNRLLVCEGEVVDQNVSLMELHGVHPSGVAP